MEDGCPRVSKKAAWKAKSGSSPARSKRWANTGGIGSAKRRYVATFGPADDVGMLTYAAACDLGATEAKQQVVLGDGADMDQNPSARAFSRCGKVLDWPHLWRKVRDAVRAVQPGKRAARRAWRKAQYEVLLPLLWEGEREQALAHLHSLRPIDG